MFILTNMITCCLVLDEGSNLWPLPRLAEEVLLLGQHFQFLMTKLLPRTINLHAFISIYLSLDYLMSSGTAHGLIPVFGPFIPTIAPRNSFFFFLRKKGDFNFLATILFTLMSFLFVQVSFQLQRGMLLTLRHLGRFHIYFIRHSIPYVLWYDGDPTMEKFYGDLGWNSPAYFSLPYIYCSKILVVPLFTSSTLKNQSKEPFYTFVSYL